MGQELPEFVATTQIQPAPVVSNAPIFMAYSRLFNQVSQTINKDAQVAEAANLNANKLIAGADIAPNINRISQDSTRPLNNNSINRFNAAVSGYSKGVMATVPRANRPYMTAMLTHASTIASQRIIAQVDKRNNIKGFEQYDHTFNQLQNQMANSARSGDEPGALTFRGQAQQLAQDAVNNGLLTGVQFKNYISNMDEQLHKQTALGNFNKMLIKGQGQEGIQQFQASKSYDKVLSPLQKESVVQEMRRLLKEHTQNIELQQGTINDTKKDLLLQARMSGQVDSNRMALVEESEMNRPGAFTSFQRQVDLNKIQHQMVARTDGMTLGEMKQFQNQQLEPLSAKELAQPGAAQMLAMRQATAHDIQNRMKELSNDPALAIEHSATYQKQVAQFQKFGTGDLVALKYKQMTQRGVPESQQTPFDNATSSALVSQIRALGPEQGLQQLTTLKAQYGDKFGGVMRGLMRNGLPESFSMAIGLQNLPKSEPYLPDMLEAWGPGFKSILDTKTSSALSDSLSDLTQPFVSSLNAASSANLKQQIAVEQNLKQYGQLILMKKGFDQSNPPSTSDIQSAANDAFTRVIGNRYSEITNNFRVPAFVDPAAVSLMNKNMEQKLATSDFKQLQADNPLLSKGFIKAQDFKDRILTGHWVTTPDEQGMAWVDPLGRVLRSTNGQPFGYKFKDLNNPQFLAELAKVPKKPSETGRIISEILGFEPSPASLVGSLESRSDGAF